MLDPDQARQIVGPYLGPNCLPRLSADDTSRQRACNTSDGSSVRGMFSPMILHEIVLGALYFT